MAEEGTPEVHVRRVRPSDTAQVAAFLNRALPQDRKASPEDVLAHLGQAGMLLAEVSDDAVGVLGWRIENLVARVTDFLIIGASLRHAVSRALMATMEEVAFELQCEAVILLMHPTGAPDALAFWEGLGYETRQVADLPRPWEQAARESRFGDEDLVLVKQLRRDRVLRPL